MCTEDKSCEEAVDEIKASEPTPSSERMTGLLAFMRESDDAQRGVLIQAEEAVRAGLPVTVDDLNDQLAAAMRPLEEELASIGDDAQFTLLAILLQTMAVNGAFKRAPDRFNQTANMAVGVFKVVGREIARDIITRSAGMLLVDMTGRPMRS
jgi:hypothetical protein